MVIIFVTVTNFCSQQSFSYLVYSMDLSIQNGKGIHLLPHRHHAHSDENIQLCGKIVLAYMQ